MSVTVITETGREATASAFEAAARLIRENPDLPLAPSWAANPLEVVVSAKSDEARIAEVDRIATILRDAGYQTLPVRPVTPRRIYGVTAWIGAGVAYKALAIVSPFADAPVAAPMGAVALCAKSRCTELRPMATSP